MDSNTRDRKRIALIGYKFCYGGLEKVMSDLSILFDRNGYEVVTIVLDKEVCYPNGGQLIALGNENKILKYLKLNTILKKSKFDYIIDFRYRLNPIMELIFLMVFYSKTKVIYTIHSANIKSYFTKYNFIAKLLLKKVYRFVSVSHAIQEKLKKSYKTIPIEVIPNTFDRNKINYSLLEKKDNLPKFKYIVAMGRLAKEKQFDKLIEMYAKSSLPISNIHLLILGKGEQESLLKEKCNFLGLNDKIHLYGFQDNPYVYLEKAMFLVLCSAYEGFGMVLLEALAVQTPVVSFDCETGPSEIIVHEKNGLLIENQNFYELKNKVEWLAQNPDIMELYSKNCLESISKFEDKIIVEKWNSILE
ncbi:glycosyltransferase [Flavobacterium sp. TP390]|uniref:Glycosyltransferase n=1 Tax=Flavobacterium profundi TaxID=1774945 RepID=A0A6I4IV65_9FLAO|nr:glycosyltransferase [Flavobacterium profundi]MVO10822.1 glycosyltransferase [Flavobacterium profundi]